MRSTLLAVAILFGLAAAPASQPVLAVSADPYDGSGAAPLVIRNAGTSAVAIDSLRMAAGAQAVGSRGIYARVTVTGTSPERVVWMNCYRYRTCRDQIYYSTHLDQTLTPGGALSVVLTGYCASCRPAGEPAFASVDTLLVYHAGLPVPLRVRVTGYQLAVAGEAGPPPASLSVSVFPTPARGAVRVALDAPSGWAAVTVADALGRRVATLHDGPLAAGPHSFALDTSALSAGVYTVRVASAAATATARLVVAR